MIFLTTTAIEIDEELLNRCLVLSVDEEREQTQAIHELQRTARGLEGRLGRQDRKRILKVHQDAQRLLRPLLVVNPYAARLRFPDHRTRTRRDHTKYLTLIEVIAYLHQHQRARKTVAHGGEAVEYIEVTADDITVANRLAHQVLGRSLDELAPQTRRMLLLLEEMVRRAGERLSMARKDYRFTRKEVRDAVGWTDFQVRTHLERLVALEYVLVHRGTRGQSYVYELLYDGQGKDGAPFLPGLVDASALGDDGSAYDEKNEHQNGENEPRLSSRRAPIEPGSRVAVAAGIARRDDDLPAAACPATRNAHLGPTNGTASYVVEAVP